MMQLQEKDTTFSGKALLATFKYGDECISVVPISGGTSGNILLQLSGSSRGAPLFTQVMLVLA